MKEVPLILFLFCSIMACTEDPPANDEGSAIVSEVTFTGKMIGVLYLQTQVLESWSQQLDGAYTIIDSTKVKTTYPIALGKYAVIKDAQQWRLESLDSFYPFSPVDPIIVDPSTKTGFHFTENKFGSTTNLQIDQLWVVPGRLIGENRFRAPFAAGPREVAQHIYLARELRNLHSQRNIPQE